MAPAGRGERSCCGSDEGRWGSTNGDGYQHEHNLSHPRADRRLRVGPIFAGNGDLLRWCGPQPARLTATPGIKLWAGSERTADRTHWHAPEAKQMECMRCWVR